MAKKPPGGTVWNNMEQQCPIYFQSVHNIGTIVWSVVGTASKAVLGHPFPRRNPQLLSPSVSGLSALGILEILESESVGSFWATSLATFLEIMIIMCFVLVETAMMFFFFFFFGRDSCSGSMDLID